MELKNKWNILSDRIRAIKKAQNGYLVLFDKFGTALRNAIDLVPELKPDMVVSERWQEWDFILETWTKNIGSIHYLDFLSEKNDFFENNYKIRIPY